MTTPATPPKTRIVVCPECGKEVDLEQVDECANCGLNVEKVYEQARYRRALRKVLEDDDDDKKKKKKGLKDFNPFE